MHVTAEQAYRAELQVIYSKTKVLEASFKVDFHYPHMKAKDTSDAF